MQQQNANDKQSEVMTDFRIESEFVEFWIFVLYFNSRAVFNLYIYYSPARNNRFLDDVTIYV